ncbi:MAG: Plasmid stabilization system [Bacteroidetes bacterium]|nr:MAG: Plasmid stabilization system [Bacteroidota bacterium]
MLIRKAITDRIELLTGHAEIHEFDKLKEEPSSAFRAFTVYHYRVTYEISVRELIIHRVRHTSREPLGY